MRSIDDQQCHLFSFLILNFLTSASYAVICVKGMRAAEYLGISVLKLCSWIRQAIICVTFWAPEGILRVAEGKAGAGRPNVFNSAQNIKAPYMIRLSMAAIVVYRI